MVYDIDVSGPDLLSNNYTICIADRDGIIKGFKFNQELLKTLCSRYDQGVYRYKKSKNQISLLKVRIYCTVIYYLFHELEIPNGNRLKLNICRDFSGRENDIKSNLEFFLGGLLGFKCNISFGKLDNDSNAHRYAYLMYKDHKNKMDTYIELDADDIDEFLRK